MDIGGKLALCIHVYHGCVFAHSFLYLIILNVFRTDANTEASYVKYIAYKNNLNITNCYCSIYFRWERQNTTSRKMWWSAALCKRVSDLWNRIFPPSVFFSHTESLPNLSQKIRANFVNIESTARKEIIPSSETFSLKVLYISEFCLLLHLNVFNCTSL